MKILLSLLFFTLSLFANNAFISAEELYKKLDDKNIVIISTTDAENFEQGHIPNARQANISAFRHWIDGTYMLMNSSQEIQDQAQKLGINNDSYVVLYGHNNPQELLRASYMALALIVNGFDNVSILDGGFNEWSKKYSKTKHAITTDHPSHTKGNFIAKHNSNILVDLEYVKDRVSKVSMIEARPKKQYDGVDYSNGVKRLGHITDAKSSFWQEKFKQDEMLADDKKLKKLFLEENKLDANKEVITYCTGGLEASMNWYILTQHLGFKDVKLYDASMKEWGNLEDTPMQK